MFYAATNSYATNTSIGFSNTWNVHVFATRIARDNFVRKATDVATRAITRKDISKYLERKPRPFTSEAYVIANQQLFDAELIDGYIGRIEIDNAECYGYIRHLYA
jgi:hypothetical protein